MLEFIINYPNFHQFRSNGLKYSILSNNNNNNNDKFYIEGKNQFHYYQTKIVQITIKLF